MKKFFKGLGFVLSEFVLGVVTILVMATVGIAIGSHSFWLGFLFGGIGSLISMLVTILFGYESRWAAAFGFSVYLLVWILAMLLF